MSATSQTQPSPPTRKPDWLRIKLVREESFGRINKSLRDRKLHTVCEEAHCPNINECWNGGTATFMILGDTCTRGCRFCAVKSGNPGGLLDKDEPLNTAQTISDMDLKYIVITSVDRDDLPDQGADHFVETVVRTKELSPEILIETLSPDWRGDAECTRKLAEAPIDVLAHNVETVERLQSSVRDPRCGYAQSMKVLRMYREFAQAAGRKALTKTSIMLGVGETDDELRATMRDLIDEGVRVLTLGQYLRPTRKHLPVQEYVSPERFDAWAEEGKAMGFAYVAAGPFVRSSYRAGEFYIENMLREEAAASAS